MARAGEGGHDRTGVAGGGRWRGPGRVAAPVRGVAAAGWDGRPRAGPAGTGAWLAAAEQTLRYVILKVP